MNKYYLAGWKIRKLIQKTTEASFYGALETCYGYEDTLLIFSDESIFREQDCLELTISGLVWKLKELKFRFKMLIGNYGKENTDYFT